MSILVVAALWVLAATLVACLPMRYQYIPGIGLLMAAPVLIYMIAQSYGVLLSGLALLAFVSMFRNPLRYFAKRAMGKKPELPK
jgi:hypothetical protein